MTTNGVWQRVPEISVGQLQGIATMTWASPTTGKPRGSTDYEASCVEQSSWCLQVSRVDQPGNKQKGQPVTVQEWSVLI